MLDLRAAVWLPVYLVGMGADRLPQRLRAAEEPGLPAVVGHARVAAFSLAIYFWALRVALPAEKIEQMIDDGAAQDGPLTAYG